MKLGLDLSFRSNLPSIAYFAFHFRLDIKIACVIIPGIKNEFLRICNYMSMNVVKTLIRSCLWLVLGLIYNSILFQPNSLIKVLI